MTYHIDPRHNGSLSEATIQRRFLDVMAMVAPKVLLVGIPNAGRRSRWEGQQRKREGMVAGFPDVLAFFDGGVMAIEFKSGKGSLSKEQKATLDRLVGLGIQVAVFRDETNAIEFVRRRWPYAFSGEKA